MIVASVHLASLSPLQLHHAPRSAAVDGLRFTRIMVRAPVAATMVPRPMVGKFGLLCIWEDDAAIDAFLACHPFAPALRGGYSVRLDPMRAFGRSRGIGDLVVAERPVTDDEPLAVVTFGNARVRALPRFLRANREAARAILGSEALLASTAMTAPPLALCSFSLWRDLPGMRRAVEGRSGGPAGHRDAVRERATAGFMTDDVFARFRPYRATGLWDGRDPLAGTSAASAIA